MVRTADVGSYVTSLKYIKRVRLSNCLWKSIPGWNSPRKKRILKCVNRRLETLELSAMTSCRVLRTWYRMVLLWKFKVHVYDAGAIQTSCGSGLLRHGLNFIRAWWMDDAIYQWRQRMEECVHTEDGHFEHLR